ncbi:endolytic transglycosylase MltG [Microbispora hainanensis]|uniref:Endolytic murein transglycosylase n=1 Tax=Microbispora hainanensis TaxID=568844 RepID=A0ABZ1SXN0_9ACTN|nr:MULTISPECIES: endolytic transglycosylase MltG [Microbispora]NJP26508.1 endolytic transglycosylase MltG [Microbispora sp. CL1-1]
MKRTVAAVAGGLALVAAAVTYGVHQVVGQSDEAPDFSGEGTGTVTIEIRPGASAAEIGRTLERAGVVASAQSFVEQVVMRSKETGLHPGRYTMRRRMAAASALDLLLAPASRVVRTVTVPEGLRTSEVLRILAERTGIPLKDFTAAVAEPRSLRLPAYAEGEAEGFLFPATYEIEPDMTAADLLRKMVARFRVAAEKVRLKELAPRVKLRPRQVVTVASIVQAEGGVPADYPKIARVVYNRLARGAKLEMDSTINYALDRHTLKVSIEDTRVDSPYNTYARPGLPPGPIGNPGESALTAALHPAEGAWYWFVTTDPRHKITKFTDKEAEFRKYREELNRYLGTN